MERRLVPGVEVDYAGQRWRVTRILGPDAVLLKNEAGETVAAEPPAEAIASARAIVVAGHGDGRSNAADRLIDFLRLHHSDTFQKVAREVGADLSILTPPQLHVL